MDDQNDFKAAVDAMGGQLKAAEALRVTQGAISQMVTGKRPVPPERCAEVEKITEGRFTCEQLRPDVAWRRAADAGWPWHPAGKPLIDVCPVAVLAEGA